MGRGRTTTRARSGRCGEDTKPHRFPRRRSMGAKTRHRFRWGLRVVATPRGFARADGYWCRRPHRPLRVRMVLRLRSLASSRQDGFNKRKASSLRGVFAIMRCKRSAPAPNTPGTGASHVVPEGGCLTGTRRATGFDAPGPATCYLFSPRPRGIHRAWRLRLCGFLHASGSLQQAGHLAARVNAQLEQHALRVVAGRVGADEL